MINWILNKLGYHLIKIPSIDLQTENVLTEDNNIPVYVQGKIIVSKELCKLLRSYKAEGYYDLEFEPLSSILRDCDISEDGHLYKEELSKIIADCGDCLINWELM